jgi:hypothetical protein
MIVLAIIFWAYRIYSRHLEIHDFFKDPDDLAWARIYLDKKIDFRGEPEWKEAVLHQSHGKREFFSPSGRYELLPNDDRANLSFMIIDRKYNRMLANIAFPFMYTDSKWAKNERFLIFRYPLDRDDWWGSDIYISDTTTGKTIYKGESLFYLCDFDV